MRKNSQKYCKKIKNSIQFKHKNTKKRGGRKMDFKQKFKRNKGITLIALVVTIIVLLILARNKHKYAYRSKWVT